eukprot:1162142-Pelagomonas_calceolata.AAC.11
MQACPNGCLDCFAAKGPHLSSACTESVPPGFSSQRGMCCLTGTESGLTGTVCVPPGILPQQGMCCRKKKSLRRPEACVASSINLDAFVFLCCTKTAPCSSRLQEGHTAHATPEEAEEMAMRMVRIYERFAVEVREIQLS